MISDVDINHFEPEMYISFKIPEKKDIRLIRSVNLYIDAAWLLYVLYIYFL